MKAIREWWSNVKHSFWVGYANGKKVGEAFVDKYLS